jgi:hypothetical protein
LKGLSKQKKREYENLEVESETGENREIKCEDCWLFLLRRHQMTDEVRQWWVELSFVCFAIIEETKQKQKQKQIADSTFWTVSQF